MQKKIDLINGPILSSLTKLALPIMATSLIQMAYNMIDMIWIGRLGSSAVASVGAAGMYMWLSNGLVTLARMGGQVHVGHAVGAGRTDSAGRYAATTFQMTLLLGVLYGLVCTIFSKPLIAFFHLTSTSVINDAVSYLMITCGLVIFSFLNQIFTGLFTAIGNSHPAFLSTSVGLVINIILDPPRAGSDERFLSSVVKLSPKKVIYISCNPETLARDLKYLTKHHYKVEKIQPVDMFPFCDHCETVCELVRK